MFKLPKTKEELINSRKNRIRFIGVIFTLCLVFLCGRIGYYIYAWGEEYELLSIRQQISQRSRDEQVTNPTRGFILDRSRHPLAVSSRVYNIVLDVKVLDGEKESLKANTLNKLNEVLGIPLSELEALFNKDEKNELLRPTNWQIIARDISGALAMQVKDLRCVYLESSTQRTHNDPLIAPQTIGFVRGDSAWGLENFYNNDLTGEAGRIYRSSDRDNNPIMEEIVPVNGYTLVTTLDAGIQRIAQAVVDKAAADTPCEFAGILVMEPYTGEILAIAQWPSFSLADPGDPNLFTDRRIRNYWDALSEEKRFEELYKGWGNYHTTRTFEPGSIFKPMVVAAALDENVIDPNDDFFFCGGKVRVADWDIPCWYRYGHGGQNVVEVLANSCNVAMIEINKRLGRDLFFKYLNDFGYGERSGIDLPGEESAAPLMYSLSQLNPVEMATSSMGQGFNNTAIQAITAFAAVINGGNVMKPYLVSQIVDENDLVIKENHPKIVRKAISASTSNYMREKMQAAVEPGGTAHRGAIEGYSIGGKTGSGQQGIDRKGMTVSMIAYTPVESPEFIILGVLDNLTDPSQLSGTTVVPMIKNAMEEIIRYKNIRPNTIDGEPRLPQGNMQGDAMRDYSKKPLVEAIKNFNSMGIDYQVSGSGTVIDYHLPGAGQPVPVNAPVFIYLDGTNPNGDEIVIVPHVEGLRVEVGEAHVWDAKLSPVSFLDKPDNITEMVGGDPVTYYPTASIEENTAATSINQQQGVIYKQFPSAGTSVPKGMEIKLKVKME